jgi:hypothetical protein
MSIDSRLEAAEEALKAHTGQGIDLSAEAQAATVARLLARMEAYKARVAARAGVTPEELAAIEAQEEAEYWPGRSLSGGTASTLAW